MGALSDRPDRSAAQASFPGTSSETKKSTSTDVSKNVKTSIRYVTRMFTPYSIGHNRPQGEMILTN